MARKPFICSPTDPYHATARSHNKTEFPIPKEQVWEIMSLYLNYIHRAFDVKIHAFVLMKNHFHLIASYPQANFSVAMQYFMRETSRQLSSAAGHINQSYGNRCFRSQITQYHHFLNVYKYVYRNPIEAGICEKAEDYEFSTLKMLVGAGRPVLFPVQEDTLLFSEGRIDRNLEWLNSKVDPRHREDIRKALKRKVFKFAKLRDNQPNELEKILY